jgi:hypothetical protein
MQAPSNEAYQAIGITREDLRENDIIFVTDYRENAHLLHQAIRFGQYLQRLYYPAGHSQSVHAAIVTRATDLPNQPLKFVEVIGEGIRADDIDKLPPCTLFVLRPTDKEFAEELGRTAYFMYKYLRKPAREKPPELANEVVQAPAKKPSAGDDLAISGPTGFRHVGKGIETLFQQKKQPSAEGNDMVVSGPSGFRAAGHGINSTPILAYSPLRAVGSLVIPLGALFPGIFRADTVVSADSFCSMFVIECMQIAQAKLGRIKYIDISSCSTPRSFESYLKHHPDFSLHIIPRDNPSIILDTVLMEEIERQKSSQYDYEKQAGLAAEKLLQSLQDLLVLNNGNSEVYPEASTFDIVAIVLSRILPVLNYPDAVFAESKMFGMGKSCIKGEKVRDLAVKLIDPRQNQVDFYNDRGEVEFKM